MFKSKLRIVVEVKKSFLRLLLCASDRKYNVAEYYHH